MFTTFGLYGLNRIPFGLTNTPATFQQSMGDVLLAWIRTLVYTTLKRLFRELKLWLWFETEMIKVETHSYNVVLLSLCTFRPGCVPYSWQDRIPHHWSQELVRTSDVSWLCWVLLFSCERICTNSKTSTPAGGAAVETVPEYSSVSVDAHPTENLCESLHHQSWPANTNFSLRDDRWHKRLNKSNIVWLHNHWLSWKGDKDSLSCMLLTYTHSWRDCLVFQRKLSPLFSWSFCGFNFRGWNRIDMSKNPSKSHATNGLVAKQNVQSSSSLSITALPLFCVPCIILLGLWRFEIGTQKYCWCLHPVAVPIWCTCLGDSEGMCCC